MTTGEHPLDQEGQRLRERTGALASLVNLRLLKRWIEREDELLTGNRRILEQLGIVQPWEGEMPNRFYLDKLEVMILRAEQAAARESEMGMPGPGESEGPR